MCVCLFLMCYLFFFFFFVYQNNATPFYMASQNGHLEVVKSLLGAGANVNIAKKDVSVVFNYFMTHDDYKLC